MKSARAAGTSRSSGLSLRICLSVKSTIGKTESKSTEYTGATDGKNVIENVMFYTKEEALFHWVL